MRKADPAGAATVTPGAARVTPPAAKAEVADKAPPATSPSTTSPSATNTPAAKPSTPPSAPVSTDDKKGPGFFPLLLGGVVAGAIGFAVATLSTPTAAPVDMSRVDTLAAEVEALGTRETPAVDLSAVEAAQTDLAARIDALTARVDGLEAAPNRSAPAAPAAGDLRADVDALGIDITTLRDTLTPRVDALEDGLAAAETRAATVETEAETLARDAARNQVRQALQSGAPFAEPLAVLGGDIPEPLVAAAETGVPAQAALIEAFPALSRDALRAARAATPEPGVGSLFRNAFNPRSLEPREGDDPDAVLSRAEAAVRNGDLATALVEIEVLPEAAQAVLGSWISRAQARAAALSAADDYLQDG